MMATCRLSENQTPSRESGRENDSEFTTNDSLQLPTVTVRDARNVSIATVPRALKAVIGGLCISQPQWGLLFR